MTGEIRVADLDLSDIRENQMQLDVPIGSSGPLPISLDPGEQLYLVGANGSGKSALLQHWITADDASNVKRIAAHRQTWLQSGSLDFTARGRRDFESNRIQWDRQYEARWVDYDASSRQSAVLFDLVAKDNTRAREIANLVDNKQPEQAAELSSTSESSFKQLNDLLALGNLGVSLSNANDEEIVTERKDNNATYSIAQMSDGERGAALIAAEVLTVDPGTIMLIDEPERHLHRSIIEPFLSALFARREDCAFVISTHEIALPIANPTARVLMLRSCVWNGDTAALWDAVLLESGSDLPEDLKQDILGARRRILFVEGTTNSLDSPLYGALFPELSVIPKGSCSDVIKGVKGLRGTRELHHVESFGLIDRDDRTDEDVEELGNDNLFALDVCTVESLYYCSDAIEAVAHRQAESLDCEPCTMIEAAKLAGLEAAQQSGLPERMAARRCERQLRGKIEALAPDWRSIMQSGGQTPIPSDFDSPYPDELTRFNQLASSGDLDGLIARYPLRESNVFNKIAQSLECGARNNYERMVVARVREDADLAGKLKQRIQPLSERLDATL